MLYPEKKERENRFKLALRMGLPIFFLGVIFIFINLSTIHLTLSFYIGLLLILSIMVYFFLYMIYVGFSEHITDSISHTFTRKYIYKILKKEIKKQKYSIILLSIENLHSINEKYGIKNGDLILYEIILFLDSFLSSKGIKNFPIGHLKGGDFLIGLKGDKDKYKDIFELFSLKASDYKINNIEIQTNISILDNNFSKNLDYMIDYLFQLQELVKSSKNILVDEENFDPKSLEISIIDAIKFNDFLLFSQNVYDKTDKVIFKELSIRLKIKDKMVYQKTFMPVINRLGLSYEFDLILLDKIALKLLKNNDKYAFNISPTTLREPKFILHVKKLLTNYPNIAKRIIFLIYEKEYYYNISRFNTIIQEIRNLGFFIVIDKFCEYHTSFLYFRKLEVDMVRFDSKYTKHLDLKTYKEILKGMQIIINNLGIKSWIKMIENEQSYEKIKNLNIDIIQGKYLDNLKEI